MFARYRDTANIICISPMGESAWSYVESTTVLSDASKKILRIKKGT